MKFMIAFGLLAVTAVVSAGHATSYQNQNLYVHGGGGGGGDGGEDGSISGGYDVGHHQHHHHHGNAYKYEYGVKDHHTGDNKDQWEHGDGHGNVKGAYTLKEADGTERVVEYHADKHGGFHAHVKRIGHANHPHIYGGHGHGHGDGGF